MGYSANSVDTDFTVPADKVPDALAALNASLTDDPEGAGYTSLAAAVDEHGGFSDSDDPGDDINYRGGDDGFRLGFHTDSWWDAAEAVLTVLAPFATEGSYVRLIGEDDCLFGFRAVDGQLRTETGDFTWTLDKETPVRGRRELDMHVWVLTFDAEGPQGGDYDGLRSVHTTKKGALLRLFDRIAELGVDPRSPEVQVIASSEADNGSTSGDLEAAGWSISYGVHNMPVEEE